MIYRPPYIAICGYPTSGKTTIAGMLVERYGAVLVDDGAVLRETAMRMYGLSRDDVYTQEGKLKTREVCGKVYTHRQLLGDMGNLFEGFYGEQFVPERAFDRLDQEPIDAPFLVFASVRKTQGITYHKRGGFVIEVVRPGTEATNDFDRYDRDLVDHTLLNVGTKDDLAIQVRALFDKLGFHSHPIASDLSADHSSADYLHIDMAALGLAEATHLAHLCTEMRV